MGQQQLLLIVLGIIIVGIAVVIGINLFSANAVEAKRNNVINDCITLSTLAQQHYRKPGAYGGGDRSFDGSATATAKGWQIPDQLLSNANGSYRITAIASQELTILGTGNEVVTGSDSVQVSVRVTPTTYFTTIIH